MFHLRITLGVAAVAAVMTTTTLLAHMMAIKSEPAANATVAAPPARVQVWFTQEPDPAVSKLELSGPSGAVTLKPVRVGADDSLQADIDGQLANGKYTVCWQSAGDDGHLQDDEFSFTVQRGR